MKKPYKIILGVILLLIAIRIYLPYGIIRYVNQVLKDLPEYNGAITDVDLHLYKGAYSIDSLYIIKADSSVQVPFFAADRIDLSLQWSALFDGAIVGEIDMIHPQLNFVEAEDTTQSQYGEDVDWTKPLKELIPVQINRLGIDNGEIFFKNFQSRPKVDLYLNNLALQATNLTNASADQETLPSQLTVSATSIGSGKLTAEGRMNLLKKVPDMDIDVKFEQVDLTALNDFLQVYGKLDAERGMFNLYSEIVIDSSQLTGYVKPLIRNLKIVKWKEDKDEPLQLIWESVAGLILEIFENQKNDQFATKVPFKGDLTDPKTKVFPALWNIFSNAFIQAFDKKTDDTLNFSLEEKE
ncbi:DUF748 domain-containing protein [Fulvivirga sp. M361]|uniref:DUF748 domain-containing protein n=1 Tax=Fulvivirga sp. M361 TaxID=2594266 RepID=UPI001179ACB5|nr:DUF748 domain-containing protein [Fulvivirga sp. M361]TRX60494.1 DUF748 domain-containing protein [Fulvivirga sp. M361]